MFNRTISATTGGLAFVVMIVHFMICALAALSVLAVAFRFASDGNWLTAGLLVLITPIVFKITTIVAGLVLMPFMLLFGWLSASSTPLAEEVDT